jgi:hypothetical protein
MSAEALPILGQILITFCIGFGFGVTLNIIRRIRDWLS